METIFFDAKYIREWIANSSYFEDGEMTEKNFNNYKFYFVVRKNKFDENSEAEIFIVLTNGDIPAYDYKSDKILNSIKIYKVE
ncbi:hypothetical protein [Acetivibrio straminisolvens]|jgi:hypothetical protein|uniref:Uncharacterized protein n=1 Tax=Acetivibrio straminisolvens JCM 21531 TaxID=1294263 RepID=W4V0J9_9FIRM|nr:hypothetical protein [Acetivibrio straminisolvens]GAE86751.1 hypothetical protein JCM21531_73 [Acetivibrio straminisolvens JCM 21531]